MNDTGRETDLLTTQATRATVAARHGLTGSVVESAAALGLEIVLSLECSRRNPAVVVDDELVCRPGDLRAALVACAAEALDREGLDYTREDAHALADELLVQEKRATK